MDINLEVENQKLMDKRAERQAQPNGSLTPTLKKITGGTKPTTGALIPTLAKPSICPDCGDAGFLRRDVPHDHPDFGKPLPCPNPVHATEKLAKLERISGLSGPDLSVRLADIAPGPGNEEMLEKAQRMVSDLKGWLYIWGGPGNAKTVALMAMVNEINEAGKGPAMYIKFTKLVEWMRESFRERNALDKDPFANLGYIQRFKKILSVPFLAIDEMDKARSTSFSTEFRFDFLDERYQQAIGRETATVFAGNTDPATLPGEIYDRVRDGRFAIVENKADSSRPFMEWPEASER